MQNRKLLAAFVIWGAVMLIMSVALPAAFGQEESDRDVLEEYIDRFHNCGGRCKTRPSLAKKAKLLIDPLLKHCKTYRVDPLLMAIVFSKESSWRFFKGDLGEMGPGHVMPNKWARQFNLETTDGQIEAAVAAMRRAHNRCKGIRGSLTFYASGSCKPRTEKTKRIVAMRVRIYQRAVRRHRVIQRQR